MPFLSAPCHNDEHFLRRKGDTGHRRAWSRGIEIPAAPCQLQQCRESWDGGGRAQGPAQQRLASCLRSRCWRGATAPP